MSNSIKKSLKAAEDDADAGAGDREEEELDGGRERCCDGGRATCRLRAGVVPRGRMLPPRVRIVPCGHFLCCYCMVDAQSAALSSSKGGEGSPRGEDTAVAAAATAGGGGGGEIECPSCGLIDESYEWHEPAEDKSEGDHGGATRATTGAWSPPAGATPKTSLSADREGSSLVRSCTSSSVPVSFR